MVIMPRRSDPDSYRDMGPKGTAAQRGTRYLLDGL